MKKLHDKQINPKTSQAPRLRFPEYRNRATWETKTLGSLATITTEKAGDNECVPMSITSGVGLVSQMEKFGRVIAGSSYKNYLLLKKNDFAYNKSATQEYPEGYIALYSGEALAAVPNSIFTCFRINRESPIPGYLNYLFHGNLHGQWLRKFIEIGARAHGSLSIDEDDLLALPVPLPGGDTTTAEQQKIADCLGSLDELIRAESQKLDALKAHKKGLMQQLFPREGEIVPRLRFREFSDAPEWEEKPIGDLGEVVTGNTPSTAKREYYDGDFPFVSPADISDVRFVETTKTTLTELGFKETRPIRAGSVVFVCIGSTIGKVAQIRRDSATNQQINSVVPNSDHDDAFVYYSLLQNAERVANLAGKQAVPIVNKSLFSSVRLPVPQRIEQHRIASCLSSIDDQIAAQSEMLESLKTHKQGLMQQLFPSFEEVNA